MKGMRASFGQITGRCATDGKSRPSVDPQTETTEANPKRPPWTTLIARPYGKRQKTGGKAQLSAEEPGGLQL